MVLLLLAAFMAWTIPARHFREHLLAEAIGAGRGRWIDAGDARIFIQEWGTSGRPTVLLVHGTGAWSGTWFTLPDALASAGWRVVAMDLPPFGLSQTGNPDARGDYSRTAQARRVLRTIDALGVPVTLVGHSFGAGPALEAAMLGGSQVRQLVLIDPALALGADGTAPHCDPGQSQLWLLRNRVSATVLLGSSVTWPPTTGFFLRQFVHRKEVVTESLLASYREPFAREGFSQGLADWALAFSGSACETAQSLSPERLKTWSSGRPPLTLLWGEQDSVTPLAQAQALMRWMPDTRLVVLPGVGHIPHIEAPRELERALLKVMAPPS